jgi:hypothetical protein
MLMLRKVARWYADKDKVETSTARSLEMILLSRRRQIMVDDDDLDGI